MSKCLYLKGFKLDPEKIRRRFPREAHEPDQGYEFTWYQAILETIPPTAFLYVACGVEPDGNLNLMVVLEDGYDEVALKKTPVETSDERLAQMAQEILTPGIWPSD